MTEPDPPEAGVKPKRRQGPKKITPSYLENAAAHYLGRFAASTAQLRRVMMQKVQRSASHHGTDPADGRKIVDDIIDKFERLGYLNDKAFAETRAQALHDRGTPLRGIRYKLAEKGIAAELIETALAKLADELDASDLDMRAAVRFAKRRRIGPFSTADDDGRRANREKDLATLARAGHAYGVAERIVGADNAEELVEEFE